MMCRFLRGLGLVTFHAIVGPALLLCLCYLATGQFLSAIIAGTIGVLCLVAFRKLLPPKNLD